MTASLEARGKAPFSKQPVKFVQVISLVLVFFAVSEFFLQKQLVSNTKTLASCLQSEIAALPKGQILGNGRLAATAVPVLVNSPTVHDTFSHDIVVHWDNLTELAPKGMRTHIDTSFTDDVRFLRYGLSPLRNVCLRPNGTIVVVGLSDEELSQDLAAAGKAMTLEWKENYNCTWGCQGVAFEKETPNGALWLSGNTTHVIPYLGNVFHHFSERVWPHLTGFREPMEGKKMRFSRTNLSVNQYYVHRMHTWLHQARHNMDRNTFMFQIALLSRIAAPGTKFLQHGNDETRPVCFESLMLTSASSGRMSPQLGLQNFSPAIERYRKAAFEYFRVPNPQLSTPPRTLRVTLYGRGDASRRRVTNIAEVAHHLRTMMQPPLLVTLVDELLANGAYNQSLPEVVSLMAQTDVYITPHGANTWSTIFLPKRAAVIEIYGPCGPTTWISKTIVPALELKHRTEGNPWGEKIASPRAGNTTECKGALNTPDFSIDIAKLDGEIQALRVPAGPGDRLPLHWLYDWKTDSY